MNPINHSKLSPCPITRHRIFLQTRIQNIRSAIPKQNEVEKEVLYKYIANYNNKLKELNYDPLTVFCQSEPWADECRIYDD